MRGLQRLAGWLIVLGGLVFIVVAGAINDYRNEYWTMAAFASITLLAAVGTWILKKALERLD